LYGIGSWLGICALLSEGAVMEAGLNSRNNSHPLIDKINMAIILHTSANNFT
jgi:hypothetical protein